MLDKFLKSVENEQENPLKSVTDEQKEVFDITNLLRNLSIDFSGRPFVFQFSGLLNSGKDTCAKLLKEVLEEKNMKVLCINYADFLKAICTRNFGYDDSHKEEGRKILQDFGTEVKKHERDFWIHTVFHFFDVMRYKYDAFIIADCRYEEELQPTPYKYTYPIVNLYVKRDIDMNNELLNHDSEKMAKEYNPANFHLVIDNNKTLDEVKDYLSKVVDYFVEKKEEFLLQQWGVLGELIDNGSEGEA